MPISRLRLAVISDLHYDQKDADTTEPCRPSAAMNGRAGDPMEALLNLLSAQGDSKDALTADYILCGGDITNRASTNGFNAGWNKLKELKELLGAKHILAVTGNHEVNSRAGDTDNQIGNSDRALDPLAVIQKHPDYPSSTFSNDSERWVYWGRGFHIIEEPSALFLLINSSHFHPTTRPNEFERGRVSDVAIQLLQSSLKDFVDKDKTRAFVALMHHHPIPHQPLGLVESRDDMYNGPQLIEVLQGTGVTWLVIHGHKHHSRLIDAQGGMGSPIVFSAGSFGAHLDGELAVQTKLQFYILEVDRIDQTVQPAASGHVRALSWSGSDWRYNNSRSNGIPDRCGYKIPTPNLEVIAADLVKVMRADSSPFLNWEEVIEKVTDLRYLQPTQLNFLPSALKAKGISCTWDEGEWRPKDLSFTSKTI